VRAAVVVVVIALAGCAQLLGLHDLPADATPATGDVATDSSRAWTIDPISNKAVPRTTAEWASFIAANHLAISPPSGLWLMQEAGGSLRDSIGTAALMPIGTPTYQAHVSGWARVAVVTSDGADSYFSATGNASLPDLSQTSMTLLIYYASVATPTGTRTVLIAGSGTVQSIAELQIDNGSHVRLVAGGTGAAGTQAYDATVVPMIVELDRTHQVQRLYTSRETLTIGPYTPLASSAGGIYVGGGVNASPPGAWLYMAGWYGAPAEMSNADVSALITALGF